MAEEEASAAAPVAVKGEHSVSIVLSYMDDEHEKAAIEVNLSPPSLYPPPRQPFRRVPKGEIRGQIRPEST
jgi:hypothetical protein